MESWLWFIGFLKEFHFSLHIRVFFRGLLLSFLLVWVWLGETYQMSFQRVVNVFQDFEVVILLAVYHLQWGYITMTKHARILSLSRRWFFWPERLTRHLVVRSNTLFFCSDVISTGWLYKARWCPLKSHVSEALASSASPHPVAAIVF